MEGVEILTTKEFNYKDFLTYYINIWKRNLIARCIDVKMDENEKARLGKDEVVELDGKLVTLGERVEKRKMLVQDALDIINAAQELLALTDEELAKRWSSEHGLRIADDMLPVAAKEGDVCYDADNREGRLESDGQGGLVCKVAETVSDADPAPESTDPTPETVQTETPVTTTEEAAVADPAPEAPSPEATA